MPEHIHWLIREPQKKNPSTVMQALKLGLARRVLAQAKRQRNPSQSVRVRAATHLAEAILRFQRVDCGGGAVFAPTSLQNPTATSQRVGSPKDESPNRNRCVTATAPTTGCPVGHFSKSEVVTKLRWWLDQWKNSHRISPGGATKLSPALQRWEEWKDQSSPGGTAQF
jgi:hypothetical protein